MQDFRAGKIPSAEFAGLVETQALREWIAEHDALAKVRGLPFRQSRVITMLVRYMESMRTCTHCSACWCRSVSNYGVSLVGKCEPCWLNCWVSTQPSTPWDA